MSVIDRALNVIAPHICVVCKDEGLPVCNSCQNHIATTLPSSCFLCNSVSEGFLTCFSCRNKTAINHVWTASEYIGPTKSLITQYKFERQKASAIPLAKMMFEVLPYFADTPTITFVPTATSRIRVRGYDHAELLATELSKLTNWPVKRLLARQGQSRQVGSKRIARKQQLETAYRPVQQNRIKDSSIVIVDDIVTTGSTLITAAKQLKKAGAKEINAVVVARKR